VLDVLPALGMAVGDLYDDPRATRTAFTPDPAIQARIEARRAMTAPQRVLDDLVHRSDIGTRLVLGIAQMRPELYFAEKWDLDISGGEADD
jgi:hypothetical protein